MIRWRSRLLFTMRTTSFTFVLRTIFKWLYFDSFSAQKIQTFLEKIVVKKRQGFFPNSKNMQTAALHLFRWWWMRRGMLKSSLLQHVKLSPSFLHFPLRFQMASQTTATTVAAAVWKVQMLTFGVFDLAAILIKHIEIHTEANSSDFTHLSRVLYSASVLKMNCVNMQFVKLWISRCFRLARFPFTTVGIQAKRALIDSGLQSLFGF